jgi:hypothetical protein
MNNRNVQLVAIGLLALLIVFSIFRVATRSSRRERNWAMANVELEEAYLHALGRAAAERVEPGTVLWVRYRPEDEHDGRRVRRMRQALLQGLGSGAWELVERPDEGMDAGAVGGWNLSTYAGAWAGQLMEWTGGVNEPSAIVVGVPMPRLSAAQWTALPPVFGRVKAWEVSRELRENVERNGGRLALQKELDEWDDEGARFIRDPQELFELEHDWLETR